METIETITQDYNEFMTQLLAHTTMDWGLYSHVNALLMRTNGDYGAEQSRYDALKSSLAAAWARYVDRVCLLTQKIRYPLARFNPRFHASVP